MKAPTVGNGAAGIWRDSVILSHVVGNCVGAFDRNLASVAVTMFTHLITFINKCYKFCTFNVIFKDSATINCTAVIHKTGLFP
jgi:hypothetical protein